MKTQSSGLKLSHAQNASNRGSGLFKQKTEPDTSLKARLQQAVIAIKADKGKGTKAHVQHKTPSLFCVSLANSKSTASPLILPSLKQAKKGQDSSAFKTLQ